MLRRLGVALPDGRVRTSARPLFVALNPTVFVRGVHLWEMSMSRAE